MIKISLKSARINSALTQSEVAKLIGKTSKTISNYEKGVTFPTSEVLYKISEIYRIPLENIDLRLSRPMVEEDE